MTEEQKKHIEVMKACTQAIQKEKPLILKGGTGLLLGYGLDRFSEDLDFDVSTSFKGNSTLKLDKVLQDAMPTGIKMTNLAVKKDTDTVTRYMLNYEDQESNVSGKLKIEVSYRNPVPEDKIFRKDGMSFLSISEIANFKIGAVLDEEQSQRTSARDLYDAQFLLNNYSQFVPTDMLDRVKQTSIDDIENRYRSAFELDGIFSNSGVSAEDVALKWADAVDKIEKNNIVNIVDEWKDNIKQNSEALGLSDQQVEKLSKMIESGILLKQDKNIRRPKDTSKNKAPDDEMDR